MVTVCVPHDPAPEYVRQGVAVPHCPPAVVQIVELQSSANSAALDSAVIAVAAQTIHRNEFALLIMTSLSDTRHGRRPFIASRVRLKD